MKNSSGKKRGIGEPGRDRHHVSAEDQRFYRARRKVVALCNVVGAEKSYYCSRCDDTYFYNSTLNPTAVLERHQRRFDCREFFVDDKQKHSERRTFLKDQQSIGGIQLFVLMVCELVMDIMR